MRALLVDDESLALKDLERQLLKIGEIEIAGAYRNAESAIQQATLLKPDVVFLDIDMPEISGLEAAEILQSVLPGIPIVFVTAYEEYAVKAFELQALDYVLKPVNQERLARTVQRIKQQLSEAGQQTKAPLAATVRCFQRLHIDYGKGEPFPWRTARSQELFAYMVYKRNQPVRKDILLEILWPHAEYKKGFTQLYTTIYQIRKSLEAAGLDIRLTNSGSDYYLNLGLSRCDVQVWEEMKETLPPLSHESADRYAQWLEAYTGHFLDEHEYLWAENEKLRLRDIWYQHAMALGLLWREAGKTADALQLYSRMEILFPHTEEVYFAVMQLYAEMGKPHMSLKKYDQLCAMLNEEYGISPSPTLRQWIAELN